MLKLKLGNIPVMVRFSFLLCVSLFLLLEQLEMGRKLLAALLIHELGHLLVMAALGQKPAAVELSAMGILIRRSRQSRSFWGELLLHCGGPLANLLFVGLLWQRDQFACAFHLILAAMNLLPICPLDGGNVTELLLERLLPPELVSTASRRITLVTLFLLFIAAIPLLFRGTNPALLLFVLLLAAQNRH